MVFRGNFMAALEGCGDIVTVSLFKSVQGY